MTVPDSLSRATTPRRGSTSPTPDRMTSSTLGSATSSTTRSGSWQPPTRCRPTLCSHRTRRRRTRSSRSTTNSTRPTTLPSRQPGRPTSGSNTRTCRSQGTTRSTTQPVSPSAGSSTPPSPGWTPTTPPPDAMKGSGPPRRRRAAPTAPLSVAGRPTRPQSPGGLTASMRCGSCPLTPTSSSCPPPTFGPSSPCRPARRSTGGRMPARSSPRARFSPTSGWSAPTTSTTVARWATGDPRTTSPHRKQPTPTVTARHCPGSTHSCRNTR